MKTEFKNFLFNKNILVCESQEANKIDQEEAALLCTALMSKFGYNVIQGGEMMTRDVFTFVNDKLDYEPAEPFYRGFPDSVKKLCPKEFLFDQLFSYYKTYGLGNFSEAQHSVLEDEPVKRIALLKSFTTKNVKVVTEEEAKEIVLGAVKDFCASSRPLSFDSFDLVVSAINEYNFIPEIKSSNTAIGLLIETRKVEFSNQLKLNEFPKVVEELNYRCYDNKNVKGLSLRNKDRKFLISILDKMLSCEVTASDLILCLEKRKIWKGILHHLHYSNKLLQSYIYDDSISSFMGTFERKIEKCSFAETVECLDAHKGSAAVIRNLDYIVSRYKDVSRQEMFETLMPIIDKTNNVVLLQMINHYSNFERGGRSYSFSKFGLKKTHTQTDKEMAACQTNKIPESTIAWLKGWFMAALAANMKKLDVGKVYVDPAFKKVTLPLDMAAMNGGVGVLPAGSRLSIPEGAVVRAFTYWEKVNDIDLSAFLCDDNMKKIEEFSWRSYARNGSASSGFIFSGDQTSGYYGGSEYFDFDFETIQKKYPTGRYIVLNNNVFSGGNFSDCFCKAGFMLRDSFNSGEVYEPKTVKTSFLINAKSTYCHLFAIDLKTREVVWLNINKDSKAIVAGTESNQYLKKYMTLTEEHNIYDLFACAGTLAQTIKECVGEKDLIFTPERLDFITRADVITLEDLEKINKYIESK